MALGHTQNAVAPSYDTPVTIQTSSSQPAPPSAVADYDYPNVPETTDPQQAATAPGTGGVVQESPEKLPFKEQVNGYAKKFAGKVFGNESEKEYEFGKKKLAGQI